MTIKDIRSDIAGKIWQIKAPAGAVVAEDDAIIVIECMKMEIPVPAPFDGKVVDVCITEGDEIAEGQLLAKMKKA